MRDPNPLVGGRGIERLAAAGIEVNEGLGEAEAKKLNEAFAKYIRHKVPFVTLKTAMTLDGKIAPPPAYSEPGSMAQTGGWITSEVARAHVHQMRHAQRCHHGRRGHGYGRRSAADRPHRTSPTPSADARHPRFAATLAVGFARGEDGSRRSHGLLLLRRGEQAARAGVARRDRGAGADEAAAGRQHDCLSPRDRRRWMVVPTSTV